MRTRVRRWLLVSRAPVLVVAWQLNPVHAEPDTTGRYRLVLGYGPGQYETVTRSCSGAVIDTRPIEYSSGGGRLDAWVKPDLRVTAVAGAISSDGPDEVSQGGPEAVSLDGETIGFAGVQLAYEGESWGLGGGFVWFGDPDDPDLETDLAVFPSVYFRAGSLDGTHAEVDMVAPDPAMGHVGVLRVGMGRNRGFAPGVRWLVGLETKPVFEQAEAEGFFGEIWLPLGSRFELGGSGSWRSAEEQSEWAVAVKGAVWFGGW